MAEKTPAEIQTLLGYIKIYPLAALAGSTDLGPLSGPPTVEGDIETKEQKLYETMGEVHAEIIVKNNVKVTVKTRYIDKALELLAAFKKGDNVYDPDKKVELTLVPITAETGAKTLTFPNAYLQPGLSYTPSDEGAEHEAELVYVCKPDEDGKPFSFGTGA